MTKTADHSGPSFTFSGEISPQFRAEFLSWAKDKLTEAEDINPLDVVADRKGGVDVTFDSGEGSIQVTVLPSGIRFHASGDAQIISTPDDHIMETAEYTDENGDAYVVYKGKTYSLGELLDVLKEHLKLKGESGEADKSQ